MTMGYLYEKSIHLYDMKLLAGKDGLDHPVEWIHMIESSESASFLHGNEVVFLTGLLYQGERWILEYARRLKERHCAGLVINVGPYIKKIPPSVISYCDAEQFPLFLLPWEVHLVDITRYLCRFIINEEKKKESVLNYLQQLLIVPHESQAPCLALEHSGFCVEGAFRACIIRETHTDKDHDAIMALLKLWKSQLLIFTYHQDIVILLSHMAFQDIKQFAEDAYHLMKDKHIAVSISIGSEIHHISQLYVTYMQASSIQILAKGQQPPVVYYDNMGLYKLLLNGTPPSILQHFYEDTLGPLRAYDETHQSHLMETLRYYLEHDCSIKETAAHEVVHRNTILYKFNKIDQILGTSVYSEENKLAMMMAFKIKDLF